MKDIFTQFTFGQWFALACIITLFIFVYSTLHVDSFRANLKKGMVVKFKVRSHPTSTGSIVTVRKTHVVILEDITMDIFTVKITDVYPAKNKNQ